MNFTPLVSIVTPSFNQAKFLEKTIRSVLDQDYPQMEYLIVDGGSTDGSLEIIHKYADRLSWWTSEQDRGQADGINKGLHHAKGDIVAWINSDDFYLPGAVTEAVRALQAHPEAGFVYSDLEVVDENGEKINRIHYGHWGLRELMEFRIIGQPTVFMRREVLQQAGYLDESFHFLLDHHLWLRLASLSGMTYIPQLWAGEHYHAASKNQAHAREFGTEAWRIVRWMSTDPRLEPLWKANRRRIEAGAERLNAFYLFDAQDYRASLKAYRRSLKAHPAAATRDWYRILFAMFSPLGLDSLKDRYLARRKKRLQ